MRGSAEVHGEDTTPMAWSGLCTGSLNDKPGIVTDDTTLIATRSQAEITGTPRYEQDSTIGDSTFTDFGGLNWTELTGLATKVLPGGTINTVGPSVVGGACDTSDLQNWGDPDNPSNACGGYFPIIHVQGDARRQSGGVGQGILLVEGALDLRGNFAFYGLIIVQGTFSTQGNGNRVIGGVFAGNASLETQALVGGSVVQTSTCATTRAVESNAALNRARPLAVRSWVDLSAAQ